MRLRVLLGLLVSGVLLWLSLRGVSLEGLAASLASARSGLLAAALGVTLLRLWASALRWQLLLSPHGVVGIRPLFALTAVGVMANTVVPVRAGEVLRAYLLGARTSLPASLCLATIVVERVLDALALSVLLFLALPFVAFPPWVVRVGGAVFLLAVGLLGGLLWLQRGGGGAMARGLVARLPVAPHLREWCLESATSFRKGLGGLARTGVLLRVGLYSVGIWVLGVLGVFLVARSVDLSVSIFAATVVLVVLTLGLMVPSAPGFVGTLQFFSVVALGLFGVPESEAFSFSVLVHTTQLLPLVLLGAMFFWRACPEGVGRRPLGSPPSSKQAPEKKK